MHGECSSYLLLCNKSPLYLWLKTSTAIISLMSLKLGQSSVGMGRLCSNWCQKGQLEGRDWKHLKAHSLTGLALGLGGFKQVGLKQRALPQALSSDFMCFSSRSLQHGGSNVAKFLTGQLQEPMQYFRERGRETGRNQIVFMTQPLKQHSFTVLAQDAIMK